MSNDESPASSALLREWARSNDVPVRYRGRLAQSVRRAYVDAHWRSKVATIIDRSSDTLVVLCPFCAGTHEHSADTMGWRQPHCRRQIVEGGEYLLSA